MKDPEFSEQEFSEQEGNFPIHPNPSSPPNWNEPEVVEVAAVVEVDPNAWMYGDLKEVVTLEQAQNDILNWMNHKQFSLRKRKDNAEWIVKLVAAVQDGDLTVNNECRLVQKVRSTGKVLTYSERVPVQLFENTCKSLKVLDTDGAGRLSVMAALATGSTFAETHAFESEDKDLKTAITLFFL